MTSRVLSASLLACTALLFACAEPVPEDQTAAGAEVAEQAADAADPCNPANLAAEALASGTKILAGVTLAASTPIAAAHILAAGRRKIRPATPTNQTHPAVSMLPPLSFTPQESNTGVIKTKWPTNCIAGSPTPVKNAERGRAKMF